MEKLKKETEVMDVKLLEMLAESFEIRIEYVLTEDANMTEVVDPEGAGTMAWHVSAWRGGELVARAATTEPTPEPALDGLVAWMIRQFGDDPSPTTSDAGWVFAGNPNYSIGPE